MSRDLVDTERLCDKMHKANGPPGKPPTVIRTIDVLRLLGFGWYFAACIAIGVGGGIALDAWLDTKPGFLLGGLLFGTAVGFLGLFKLLMPLYRARSEPKDNGSGDAE